MNFEYNPDQLFVVGIAASAGGLEPMMELVKNAVCHGSMTFVVVSHVARYQRSALSKILDRISELRTLEIEDGMSILNCHLYTIPPNRYVTIEGSKFKLSHRPEGTPNNSADTFLESLASTYGSNAIGVVLSGASVGADGSAGVCAIKQVGGHTYAQDPATAEFSDMPELAIETGCIDSTMSPAQIGEELALVAWAN